MEELETIEIKRKGKTLWILGIIVLVIGMGLFAIFNSMLLKELIADNSLGLAIVLAFGLVLYYLPGCIAAFLSFVFTLVAWRKDKTHKGKLITFIISSVLVTIFAIEYLLFYIL